MRTPASVPSGQPTLDGYLGQVSASDPLGDRTAIFGRYRVLALAGSGGMGSVYRVWDEALDEEVALKMLRREVLSRPDLLARFRSEVKLARRVSHPNVVRTFDLGEHDGDFFLTMEYVAGRSLRRALLEDGPLSITETVALGRALCAGIGAAHQAGVLHSDLKPDNVLLGADGRVAITDFGIARVLGQAEGRPAGTPGYMAPEQASGQPAEPRADLYAIGAVLYEALTGQPAFPNDTAGPDAAARASQIPPDPRAVRRMPDALAALVARCLAPNPKDRFASAEALDHALAAVEAKTTTRTPPPAPPGTPTALAPSVAVLPFHGGGGEDELHLAEGFTEELIDALSSTRGLRVRPLSPALRVTPEADLVEKGKALAVSAIVAGSARRHGDQVVISVRLIGVADGFQLWARRFRGNAADTLVIADGAARAVAAALATELSGGGRAVAADPVALDLYLRARHELRTNWDVGAARAVGLLEEARAISPEDPSILSAYAMAQARNAYFRSTSSPGELGQRLEATRRAAEIAVARAPDHGEAWLALAHALLYSSDPAGAARALRAAVRHAPGLARAQQMLGNLALEVGRVDEALVRLRAALSIDPDAAQTRMDLSRVFALLGQWEEVDALLTVPPHATLEAPQILSFQRGRLSLWAPGRDFELSPEDPNSPPAAREMNAVTSIFRAVRDNRALPPEMAAAARARIRVELPLLRATRSQITAEICAYTGEAELGMLMIETAVEAGLTDIFWMDRCPSLAPLRALPGWAALHAVVRERAERVAAVLDAP